MVKKKPSKPKKFPAKLRAELRAAMSAPPNDFEMARAFFPEEECESVKREVAIRFEEEGKRLYLGTDYSENPTGTTVRSMWGGEYARQVAEIFAAMVSAQLHVALLPMAPAVCPTYCTHKRKGTLESEGFQLAVTIADALVSVKMKTVMPVTSIAAYVVKKHVMDPLCLCGEPPISKS